MTRTISDALSPAFDAAFDAAVAVRAPALAVRPEAPGDTEFLRALFVRCSPLAAILPPPMLDHQAAMQRTGHAQRYPQAMRRIASIDGTPVGRIVIDWTEDYAHCVDVAVLPEHRGGRVGEPLLRAWLDVADAAGLATGLMVLRDNPALRLYRRLGFACAAEEDGPYATMLRPPVEP